MLSPDSLTECSKFKVLMLTYQALNGLGAHYLLEHQSLRFATHLILPKFDASGGHPEEGLEFCDQELDLLSDGHLLMKCVTGEGAPDPFPVDNP